MAITLTYRGETLLPVEVEGFVPDWAFGKSLAEIERFEIFHGNRKIPLADMFSIRGDAGGRRFDFDGDLSGVHWIGAHMRSGEIHIHGHAGRHVGSEMRGGEIHVEGDAADWLGCEMRGGFIYLQGNAGNLVGAAYRGSAQGMRGGTIVIEGNAANEIGLLMKQGMIAIGGDAGDMVGFNMTDGAILVFGGAGIRAGAGMKGGTIALLGANQPLLLPSFRFDRTGYPERLVSILKELLAKKFSRAAETDSRTVDVYVGDLVVDGKGEIVVPTRSEIA
jgi:formylmethanofuran dehydrogenase subunit C